MMSSEKSIGDKMKTISMYNVYVPIGHARKINRRIHRNEKTILFVCAFDILLNLFIRLCLYNKMQKALSYNLLEEAKHSFGEEGSPARWD